MRFLKAGGWALWQPQARRALFEMVKGLNPSKKSTKVDETAFERARQNAKNLSLADLSDEQWQLPLLDWRGFTG